MTRWRIAFWLAVAVSYVAAIVPAPEAPDPTGWDKANHMLAFVTMALLAVPAYPARRVATLGLGLLAFGALIEATQAIPFLQRDAEIGDWLADGVATAIGLLIAVAWRRFRPRSAS